MVSVLNNITSLNAQRNLGNSQAGLNKTINRLSTGLRISHASDDAAGLQISNNLRADIRILNQARRNANDGIGVLAIADGVLEESTSLLTRAAELAEQAASGTTSSSGRNALNAEFTQIKSAINALGTDTKFNGQAIFGSTFSIQVGDETTTDISVSASTLSATTLGISSNTLSTAAAASAALGTIQTAINTVSTMRGNLGATEQRLNTVINSLGITSENLQAAESQIRDADIATEVVNLTKFQILTQSGVSALAQANASQQSVLSLLG
jgi:flagellin